MATTAAVIFVFAFGAHSMNDFFFSPFVQTFTLPGLFTPLWTCLLGISLWFFLLGTHYVLSRWSIITRSLASCSSFLADALTIMMIGLITVYIASTLIVRWWWKFYSGMRCTSDTCRIHDGNRNWQSRDSGYSFCVSVNHPSTWIWRRRNRMNTTTSGPAARPYSLIGRFGTTITRVVIPVADNLFIGSMHRTSWRTGPRPGTFWSGRKAEDIVCQISCHWTLTSGTTFLVE